MFDQGFFNELRVVQHLAVEWFAGAVLPPLNITPRFVGVRTLATRPACRPRWKAMAVDVRRVGNPARGLLTNIGPLEVFE